MIKNPNLFDIESYAPNDVEDSKLEEEKNIKNRKKKELMEMALENSENEEPPSPYLLKMDPEV